MLLFTSNIDSPLKDIDYVKVSKIIDLFGLLFDTVIAKKSEKQFKQENYVVLNDSLL